VWAAGKTVWSL